MAVNKIVVKINGNEEQVMDFNLIKSGLAPGQHTITVETYDGTQIVGSQTNNFSIQAGEGALDPDYQAVINYATNNGIPIPDATQQEIDNQIMVNIKASDAWDKTDIFFKFNGSADPRFKLIDWKRVIQATPSELGLTWSVDGVEGDGIEGYIDPHWRLIDEGNNWSLNSAGVFWVGNKNPEGTDRPFGMRSVGRTGDTNFMGNRPSENNMYGMNSEGHLVKATYQRVGANGLYRISDSELQIISDATYTINNYSNSIESQPFYILAAGDDGVPTGFSREQMTYIVAGSNMSTEHNTLKTILV